MFLGIGNSVPISKGGHRPPNPGFEYDPIAWCQDDGTQTPTVTGDPGGVFSYVNEATGNASGLSSFDTATGAIGANSTPGSYAITYTVNGVSETDVITISPDVSTSFTYPSTAENRFTVSPTQSVATAGVYSFTVNPGNITFANGAATSTTGEINLTGAALGSYTVQFLPNSSCGNPTTASFTVVQAFESFEFTIQTSSPNETFTIPTTGSGYSYHVDWGTGTAGQNNFAGPYTGNVTSPVYNSAGTYTVKIGILNDTFPRIYFNYTGDKDKIRNIVKWGEFQWTSFANSFYGCFNLDVVASDTPDLTNCNAFTNMFHRCFPSLTGTTAGTNWNWTLNNNASDFTSMFQRAGNFNGDISNWNTSKVTSMSFMFAMDGQGTKHQFNQNIGSWDVGEVTNMSSMFNNSIFNQDISNWDTSKVTNMSYMFFANSNFNQDINTKDYPTGSRLAWDVSACTDFRFMFNNSTSLATSVNKWKIHTGSSNVDMRYMFAGATSFNSSLNTEQFTVGQGAYQQTYLAWDVQKVNNLSNVIKNTQVTTSLSNWDTSNATTIQELFKDTSFNQPLVNQQVTVGTGSTQRIYNAWDVSNVTNMFRVFRDNSSFNQDLSSWDINTSGNVNMKEMFYGAGSFDQDLSNWTVTNVNNFQNFMVGVTLSTTNYDAILTAWDAQGTMAYSGTVNFGNSVPSCDNAASNGAFAARASLITKWGGITDKFSQNNTCQPLAGFDYTSNVYCANGSNAAPTITGTVDQALPLGGNISDAWSSTTGLQINNLTGEIDVDQSTTGTYQITRTVSNSPGSLSSSATDTVTINPADNAAFSYSGSPYDIASSSNPTPTVTGLSGGTFSSTSGLVFIDSGSNTGSSTGQINLSASTLGSYTITYNTTGATGSLCPATNTQSVQLVNTNFDFPSNVCNASGSPTILPTNFTQQAGGVFSISPTSGAPGIDATSGLLSPAGSTAGTYAITYTIGSNSTTKNVTSTNVLAPSTTTNISTLSFNGNSSYIDAGNSSDFQFQASDSFSISAWIYPTVSQANRQMIIGNRNWATGPYQGWDFRTSLQGGVNRIEMVFDSGGPVASYYTTTGVSLNQWHHVVGVYDASPSAIGDRFSFYIDGSIVGKAATSAQIPTTITYATKLTVGAIQDQNGSQYAFWNGKLDEVAIWNKALTSCDAAGIYQASSNGITADLSTVYPSNLKYYNRMGD